MTFLLSTARNTIQSQFPGSHPLTRVLRAHRQPFQREVGHGKLQTTVTATRTPVQSHPEAPVNSVQR